MWREYLSHAVPHNALSFLTSLFMVDPSKTLYLQTCMTKMALSTFFPCADHIDTPSEENIETLIGMMRIK